MNIDGPRTKYPTIGWSHIKTLDKLVGAFLDFGHVLSLSIFEK